MPEDPANEKSKLVQLMASRRRVIWPEPGSSYIYVAI